MTSEGRTGPGRLDEPHPGAGFRQLAQTEYKLEGHQKDYVVNGDMSGGFALVAYPAKYGSSGVMTFIVNQDGVVYQRDLGKDTPTPAAKMTVYNPDNSWEIQQTP